MQQNCAESLHPAQDGLGHCSEWLLRVSVSYHMVSPPFHLPEETPLHGPLLTMDG